MSYSEKSFIEVQFPVSKISKESYKERKAGSGQTLTGLGKWWGRKPLVLVRAALLGLLMPASKDPKKDREIFLKILMMDRDGLWFRKNQAIPVKIIMDNLTPGEKVRFLKNDEDDKIGYKKGITKEEKEELQSIVFDRLSYDEKLVYCARPEEVQNTKASEWAIINQHLGTQATNFEELIRELGEKKFGHKPVVGDCFCGGGSIPFEAARIGFSVYASDLNPLAGLLTWADLNILNKCDDDISELTKFQEDVFDEVVKQIDKWGIETNEKGWRAKYYLYCNEITCPECGCKVPLAPSWVVSQKSRTIAKLSYNPEAHSYDIVIVNNPTKEDFKAADENGTVRSNNFVCPHCGQYTPISAIRKDRKNEKGETEYGLRRWGINDIVSQENDIYRERLFCIKYIEKFENKNWMEILKKPAPATDSCYGNVYYCAPTPGDIEREEKVLRLLEERFHEWQNKGYIPNSPIEEGYNTSQIIRERGWSYWHQLFNPRQLLINGLFMEQIDNKAKSKYEKVIGLLGFNKCIDRMSKLCMWHSNRDESEASFSNQALNTLFVYSSRTLSTLYNPWIMKINNSNFKANSIVKLADARNISYTSDIWVTDPPYADAVNYHELSEFFLAWDKAMIAQLFSDWYVDSKRALAVKGAGQSFNSSMVDIYKNLAEHMPDNGMQIVMFTHQNVSVWAELTLILWSAGLRVTSAWNIATETESGGLKDGNYVKGTVLLVLRKQISEETAYLDELYPEIEEEVKRQIDSMRELDDKEDPNFSDADYLLAAYAASLKVLTSYKQIEDIDVKYELSKTRMPGEESPIEKIINEAVKIAYDYLIPGGFDSYTWKILTPEERFFIKGLDLEKEGIYQVGAYQELARGFGVKEYKELLASAKANQARLKTAMEFGMRGMSDNNRFGSSLLRNVLAALHQSIKEEDTQKGRNWLKNEVPNYWTQRNTIVEILDYIATLGHIENMSHWGQEASYAKLLRELVKNDGV